MRFRKFFSAIAIAASAWGGQTFADAVKFEAESGALGSDFAVSNGSPSYITITTDNTGNNPGSAARVASYTVTFPVSGAYDLYAHVRVGAGGFNDDSMFYGNGFGPQDPTTNSDWVLVNGLANVGSTNSTDVVTGGGSAGTGVWKWINLSQFAPGPTFAVTSGNLTQTFQIGARENGLDIDAFVFGLSDFTFTVADLDAGAAGAPPVAGNCAIDWATTLQRMDGFGGGVVFLDAGLDPVSDANMNTLYGTNGTQLGLTLLRVRIDPGTNWSAALSDGKKAVARGARVLATPWTPPASMKDNTNIVGGSVLPSQYGNFASYLNFFAGYMKSNGAPLAAVSLQNEPDFLATYESCIWTATEFQAFCHTNAPAITNAPILMPESFHYDKSLSDPTLNDPVAATNISFVGLHLYGGTISDYPNAHNEGKPTWMTEFLLNDQTINSAIDTAQQIHDCLTTGNMSAYIWWKTLGNSNGLVNASGVAQKRGYVMAQFSRFVRPGNYRITTTNDGAVLVTAFRDTNSSRFAIVAINPASIPLTPTFHLQNFPAVTSVTPWVTSPTVSLATQAGVTITNSSFAYTLPGLSVVTFVGQPDQLTLAPVSNQTVNAGFTLMATNVATATDMPDLAFSLLAGPTNARLSTVNGSNGVVTWRPFVSQAGTTNQFVVEAAENDSSLSATNSFTVTVNPLSSKPMIADETAGAGGSIDLGITGPAGPDYTLLTSTNFLNWQALLTTNPPATPFTLTVTNAGDSERYYQIQIGP